jgi:hypothetical protein
MYCFAQGISPEYLQMALSLLKTGCYGGNALNADQTEFSDVHGPWLWIL